MVDRVLRLPDGTRFQCWRRWSATAGASSKELDALRRQGLRRVNVDGELFDLSEDTIKIDKNKSHTIEVYIDRLVVKPDVRQRLTESIELGLQLAEGIVKISPVLLGGDDEAILADGAGITDENGDITFSERFACVACGISYPEIRRACFRSITLGRLSGLRWHWRQDVLRSRAHRPDAGSVAARGRDRAVGEAQRSLLSADPRSHRRALHHRHDDAVVRAAAGPSRHHPLRLEG